MNTTFEIKQSYNAQELWVKITSQMPTDVVISEYNIQYNIYDANNNEDPIVYSYTIDDAVDISIVTAGLYIPISDFTSTEEDATSETLNDGVYSFEIDTTYSLVDNPSEILTSSYNGLECFYQNILNTYTQAHLDYN